MESTLHCHLHAGGKTVPKVCMEIWQENWELGKGEGTTPCRDQTVVETNCDAVLRMFVNLFYGVVLEL